MDEEDGSDRKREKLLQKAKLGKKLQNDDMDAANADKILRPLENYVGVFQPAKLKNIKIVSYPASILVLTDAHWISFYITDQSLEVMDSMGYFGKDEIGEDLRAFVTAHATAKTISTTPRLQPIDSDLCALYAICFLYFRSYDCGSLCDFCKKLRPNLSLNTKIIKKLFSNIKSINKDKY